jgi:hypothetical protein
LTDNKALAHLLSNPVSKMPARIERLRLKLQGYRFRIVHIKGTDNLSDYGSRHPVEPAPPNDNNQTEAYINRPINIKALLFVHSINVLQHAKKD